MDFSVVDIHIARMYGSYMVMRFLLGVPTSQLIFRGRWSFSGRLLKVLAFTHSQGINCDINFLKEKK